MSRKQRSGKQLSPGSNFFTVLSALALLDDDTSVIDKLKQTSVTSGIEIKDDIEPIDDDNVAAAKRLKELADNAHNRKDFEAIKHYTQAIVLSGLPDKDRAILYYNRISIEQSEKKLRQRIIQNDPGQAAVFTGHQYPAEKLQLPCFLAYESNNKLLLTQIYNFQSTTDDSITPTTTSITMSIKAKSRLSDPCQTEIIEAQRKSNTIFRCRINTAVMSTVKPLFQQQSPESLIGLKLITLKEMDPTKDLVYNGYTLSLTMNQVSITHQLDW
ncbi:unnamed protein product [Didymodactylos carnosus]|uniref:Uncharacterized protein n=1 Tax=Didymodactylos carnosus TaxID=1234261 RepID=A0A8S2EQM0_9BILA|nr:unnamed protein product [Didymodactylos carnosus]CAF4021271.1 unnamed protein product [Didymodactylos carnosus]